MKSYNYLPILLALLFIGNFAIAQTQFQKTAGSAANDRNYHLTMMQDGSPVATGYTEDIAGNQNDAYVIKYNRFGEVDWAQTYGDVGDESSWDIIATDNDELVGVGTSTSLPHPFGIATITKLDDMGDVVWSTGLLSNNGNVDFYRVMQTASGHFVATGLVGTSGSGDDIVVCKFNDSGTLLWSRNIGSTEADEAMGITETAQGDYLLAGLTDDNTGNGSSDFAAVKLNPSGQVIWKKLYGGSNGERLNTAVEVDNSYYFAGWSASSGQGADDMIVMNTDTAGNVNWVKSYGTAEDDRAFQMIHDTNNNQLIIGGYTDFSSPGVSNRNTLLMSIELDGSMNWAKSYGAANNDGHWPTGLAQNDDAGYYVLGSTNSFGAGNMDLYLTKTDSLGNTACNQKDPMFTEADVTGWNGVDFGTASNISLNTATLTAFSGANWSITTNAQCCQLYAEAGNNDVLCPGDTATVGSPSLTGYSYTWTENSNQVGSGSFYDIPYGNGGTYQLEASATGSGCSAATDIVVVTDKPKPNHGFQSIYEFCEGDSATLTSTASYDSMQWYSRSQKILLDTGSTFTATESDSILLATYIDECVFYDTIHFREITVPNIDLGNDTMICEDASLTLEAPLAFDHTWLHDTSITSKTITIDTSGTYILQLSNEGCSTIDTIEVTVNPVPAFSLGSDTALCTGSSVTLQGPAQYDYTWMHDATIDSHQITVDSAATYIAQATNQFGCTYTDSVEVAILSLPNISLGNDTAICQDDSLILEAPAQFDYTWLHDTSITSSTIAVDTAGIYILEVKSQEECAFTDSIEVTVNPLPDFSLGNDTSFCEGNVTVLQAPMNLDHTWLHDTSIASKSIVVDTSGTYVAQVTDQNGCSSTDSIDVTLHPLPAFSLGSDTAICEDESMQLEVPAQYAHIWLHDTSITEKTITVDSPGTYIAQVTDQTGCSYTDSIALTVNPLPVFSLGNDTAICEGASVVLEAPAQYDFTWLHDTSITSANLMIDSGGSYVLQASDQGCSCRDTMELTINPLPTISLGPDQAICPDSTAIITPEGNFSTFEWISPNSAEDSLFVNMDSTVIAMGESSEGCHVYDTASVSVHYVPDSIFMDDHVSFSDSVVLNAGSIYMSYQWDNGSTTQTTTVTSTGWYSVTVTTVEGCDITDSIFADKVIGIAKTQPSFNIYPNPVKDQLKIEMKNLNEPIVHARILSITGQEVRTVRLSGSNTQHTVAVDHLAQGIYLLELRNGAQTKKVIRFVKE